MYEVSVRDHFDAAHYLREYGGKCENLHGHRFQVVVSIKTDKTDDTGLAYDFTILKQHLREILVRIDHTCLNDIPPFDKVNPSSENISLSIYNELKAKLGKAEVIISNIQVWESPDSYITYYPEETQRS